MDLFHLLGSGANFNKQRFHNDVEIFESTPDKDTDVTKDTEARDQLLEELDFFKTTHTIVDGKKSKKNKIKNNEETTYTPSPLTKYDFTNNKEVEEYRKHHRIRVYGTDVPEPFQHFADLSSGIYNMNPKLLKNLYDSKYTSPTPIQMQAIPIMVKERDLMACAPTGSGKTMAYLLPILHDLKKHEKVGYRALIIAPTRELAQQIDRELSRLSTGTKLKTHLLTKAATAGDKTQLPEQRQKFDILISTPMRLIYAVKEKEVDLAQVRHLILDEADKLLELGFLEQTDEIFAAFSGSPVRKALFSATFSPTVEELAQSVMKNPTRVVIGSRNAATETIKQQLLFTGNEAGKMVALRQYVSKGLKPPVLIFVQSIDRAKELFKELVFDGINVEVIHSDRTKAQRENIIDQFRLGRIWVLIATELMARGLDFKGVNLVINYDFPQSIESYIHRIGRTGRAGRQGEAITYYTKDDFDYLKTIVNVMRESGCEVPDWMLSMKKAK
ncbi:P-loop containing nucleoside triphosphate hydrolase protein [Halteromyces radiatus]|uniref:P-loop containing nucleoside triphosphate hydrolase protein n=1 Tax=Halteromyces radiatus TaxID=101107 RepID=UPI002220443C|nr:P-loop containing nucleoside triphosphate hydrolase protein [Halteromyces radiatus]KAI8096299.1 P-loop containing nucleoside triphosphate hydrolase protein [Halteromyces radiatus]